MQARNQETIENLSQKASNEFNQGEFDQALSTWRRLLLLDPQNVHAIEGVKMCEMLSESTSPGDELVDLGTQLDEEVATAAPAPELDFDFSELDDLAPAFPDGAARQSAGLDPGTPGATSLPLQEDEAEAPSVTDLELKRRVGELFEDATRVFESGDAESAMIILSRLFILDEDNVEAEVLRERIRATLEPHADEPDEEEDLLASLAVPPASPPDLDLPAELDRLPELDNNEAFEEEPPAAERRFGREWKPPSEPTVEETDAGGEVSTADVRARMMARLPGGRVVWAVGALLLVGLIGGKLLLGLRSTSTTAGDGATGGVAVVQQPAVAVEQPAPAAAPPAPAAEPAPPPPALTAEEKRARIEKFSAAGSAALAREAYAEAVLAYTEVVKLDPSIVEAIERLEYAAAQARVQQAIEQKWEEGVRSWNDGRYRQALAAFYRLPDGVDAKRLNRYKLNGWYNMGVEALRTSDCASASSHFDEARAIAPNDPGVQQGLELVSQCREGNGVAFRALLTRLQLRGLED